MNTISLIGLILTGGYFFGLIAEKLKLPRVTAYIFAGVLISPELLGQFIERNTLPDTFSQICLGFIAYIVGGEISFKKVKEHKSTILVSTLLSSILPVIFVFLVFYLAAIFFNIPREIAIVLAAISSTTAPAATVAIIEQYKAKGELTETTLGIVVLDDALGILLFILISSLFFPNGEGSGFMLFSKEVLLSIGLGSFLGMCLSKFAKLSPSNDYLLPLLIGLILLSVGLSQNYHFSSLLTCISLGLVANNTNLRQAKRVSLLLPIDHLKELVFIIFFVLSGSHFTISHFLNAFFLILLYVFSRGFGKYLGAWIGCSLTETNNKKVPSLLGLTLLPQAGVALGLLIQIIHIPSFNSIKDLLFNIILGSTIIYEVIGPILARYALEKAGEIKKAL